MTNEEYLKVFKRCINEYLDTSDSYMQTEAGEDSTQAPPMGAGSPVNTDPSMGGGANSVEGLSPQAAPDQSSTTLEPQAAPMDGGEMDAPMPTDQSQTEEDVEEIDVDQLVDAQESTEKKVQVLLKKFSGAAEKMVGMADEITSKIDAATTRISELEDEMKKRNPTPTEKMNLRSLQSGPFSVSTEEYWKETEAKSNYSVGDDKNGEDDERYKITKGDIDSMTDYNSISKDLNLGTDLKKIFDF